MHPRFSDKTSLELAGRNSSRGRGRPCCRRTTRAGSYPREHPENARVGMQSEASVLKKKRRRGVRPSKEHDCQYTMATKYILLRTSCGPSSHAHSPHGEWFETLLPASERPTKEQGHP